MKQKLKIAGAIALLWQPAINAKTVQLKVEDIDGNPIPNTIVKVIDVDIVITTDNNGLSLLDLPEGQYTLDVKAGSRGHFHHQIQITDNMSHDQQNPLIISLKEEPGHKIVISAHPLEHTALDMATPTILLSGEELISKRAGTLGEILRLEPGMNMSSFGPAVSRPIIRGLSGGRIKITNNQMLVQDASTVSADHDVGLEPLLAEQIEVVKGPATLLYGSGAIGGVVNVTDRKISPNVEDGISGGIEVRLGDSSTGEQSAVFTLDGGSENWNWHLDGYDSSTNDLQIPGFAESAILRQSEEAEEEHEEEEAFGVLENTASSTQGGSIGSTFITEKGYWGVSMSRIEKKYGIPGHAHHEEESAGEEEHHDEEEEEEGAVVIDMSQTRYDIQTKLNQPFKGIEQLFVGIAYTDYQHQELEGVELGTQFSNKATEFKSYIKHSKWQSWLGVIGVQLTDRDFSAIGDEAIVPPSRTKNAAVFWLEEKNFGALKWELGARFETQSIDIDLGDNRSNNGLSYSIGSVYSIAEHNKLAFNISHAVRFPSAEEYLSNGAHLATQSFEIGNPNLNNESSNNFDFSYRFETDLFEMDKITGELNLFYNQFSDFIFAENVLLTDPCLTANAITEAQESELLLVCFKQQDVTYTGLELQLEVPLARVNGHELNLDLFADLVRAELKNGDHLARIPASKTGAILNYNFHDFSADLTWVQYQTQNRTGQNELATKGFELFDLELAYRMAFKEHDLFVFLKGNNLLDEEARDHGTFIKDIAPRVGRNVVLGMRYTF